ncbi:MAG: ATP-dependent DNA helicase RecG [Pseudophaeobacter sp. bin_em_oilr2.035]|uniref:ATP-dependent DNA helicase RecG n=1 Tax=Phaeobacter gallaeciensis TaxID=60890 RepID=A0ABD4X5A6_9RHOB|nr:ATP-dependent DNA helicase RecG [Phaeobacter gallaeciensis]MDF1772833.1 ATP-dependent DNA helicase RecG [Pseudophaeobacter sp. bin_em_oilr2.035]MDE4143454.1 ATP-dependent DNA helicase RecG [Phaeobacter gallaeciensis]MDE4156184.1 ATP-dependent DNA helicase RecG [Phaeobacter gallaeciensis]MDE4160372.1 ATP-dependent DNA helicase RecG [Phaeobacter gallaeciensis]MDE4164534.1 ATP-dependent DNA helicase RecG [Phaeobacter gallaeciensis]
MSGRPEILFPLFSGLEKLPGIGPKTAQNLEQIHIETPRDLLFLLPYSVQDRRRRDTVAGLELPTVATVEVTIGAHRPPRNRGGAYRITVTDAETDFQLVFFHGRSRYLEAQCPEGSRRLVSGKLELFDGIAQMVHPDHMVPLAEAATIPEFEPVYHLTHGVSQKTMFKALRGALDLVSDLPEWIDPEQVKREAWPSWDEAITTAHEPQGQEDLAPDAPARARLAYDELFAHQLTLAIARQSERKSRGIQSQATGRLQSRVLSALPYRPTGAQTRAIEEISADMASDRRMNRLLQGDVGAGKTLVALMALLVAVEAGGQGVMMAPTSILAQQHYEGLRPLAEEAGVVLELLTGRDKGAERKAKLAALERGDIQILVGTHAVFQQDVHFADLRLAIVDEQHRFGVRQRMELAEKGMGADVLVMTATPIPRSLALAQYGDMDVSVLDEKPPGRKPVKTAVISTERTEEIVSHLRHAIEEGRQCYWVCPLVGESEVMDLTAAEERFKLLRAALGEGVVGLVHGQMPVGEKDAAMAAFQSGETKVLVATTVIEVGVNVPNASIMVIERAEIFGLAQLHQLRGRVGRGSAESTCLLMYQPPLSEGGRRRLEVLRETEDGFRISETDLEMRGAGDMIGTAQSGLPRFRIADLERQAPLMAVAQSDARALLAKDPDLTGPRGQAARVLLWLMKQDQAFRLISVG